MASDTDSRFFQSGLALLLNLMTNAYLLAIALLFYLVWNKYAQGLNTIPGPFLAGFSSVWRLVDVWRGSAQWTVIRLHRELGPLVRTGPKHVSVSDPQAINVIYGVKPRFLKVCIPRSAYSPWSASSETEQTGFYPSQSISWEQKPQANLFSTLDEKYHDEQKKKVGGAYTLGQLLKMGRRTPCRPMFVQAWHVDVWTEPAVDSCIQLFMSRLSCLVDQGGPINLGEWLEFYAFDVIGEITFSKKMGFLEQGADVDGK